MVYYTFDTIKYNPYTSVILYPGSSKHITEFWTITYLIRGELFFEVNDVNYQFGTTQIAIIPPNIPHQQLTHSPDYAQRDIYVSDEKMRELCNMLSADLYTTLMENNTFFDVLRLNLENVELLLNSFPVNSSIKNEHLSALHTCAIIFILTLFLQSKTEQPIPPDWLISIERELSSPKNIQKNINEIISTTHYSHSYICKQFKKYYGCSAISYLNKNKIIYSVSLLTDKKFSITDIAFSLGFSTQNSYIKFFKSYYGISPGLWRKNNLKNKSLRATNIWGDHKKV